MESAQPMCAALVFEAGSSQPNRARPKESCAHVVSVHAADTPATADPKKKNVRLRAAGNEVMTMMGVGMEGAKPKAAIVVAADAFAEAGKEAELRRKGGSKKKG